MTSPHLFFLGAPHLERDDEPVELTTAKGIALLGLLAVAHEPQPRERLLGLLWGESAEEAARKNLRNTLWSIRKALGDDVLDSNDDRLGIRDSAWVDVREFEKNLDAAPQAAIELFRGPLLDGITLADAPEFELWLTGERERLAQLYSRVLMTQVDVLRQSDNWREVVNLARRALAHDNLQEPVYRILMEAHARLGERSEALKQYDVLQATLERELGVEPLPETLELRSMIAKGAIQPDGNSGAPYAPGEQAPYLRLQDTKQTLFIGRQAERQALDAELGKALEGHARIVLLTGEVGIGKSRLWLEWSATFPAQATVLETQSLGSTQALTLAPVARLFGDATLTRRLFVTASAVSPIWLAEVARLLPELRTTLPNLPTPPAQTPEEERLRLFEALTRCLDALGARPLVLFFDDVHWADRPTLDWLDYIVHRLVDRPLLLVLAYRPEDAPVPLIQTVARWGREGLTHKIQLQRLSPMESAALIASLGGDPRLGERVQAQSAGNPYFLIELYRALPTDIPPVLADLVRSRLDRLPDTAHQVLQAASVLQPNFDFATLRRTSGRSEHETIQALDTLLDALVLVERDGHYEFSHPLIAEVVERGLSGARRAFVHRRAAQALEATHAQSLSQVAGTLAAHYAQAGDTMQAAHYAEMAAERALELGASPEAIDLYRQALALEGTAERRMGLGRVLLRQVELEGARSEFQMALDEFQLRGDRRGAARAALNISETYFPSGRFEEGRKWISKAMTLSEGESDQESRALAHLALASGQPGAALSFADTEKHLNAAVELAVQGQLPDIAARSSFVLGNLFAERGELERSLDAFGKALEYARASRNDYYEILAHNNIAYHAMLLGDLATAHKHLESGLALAEERALRLPLQHLYSTRGEIALAEKNWAEAEEWFNRARVESEKNGNAREIANDLANLGQAARGRGDLDGALFALGSARESAAKLTDLHLKIKIDLWLAELYLARGERAAAKQILADARKHLARDERKRLAEWADRLERQANVRS